MNGAMVAVEKKPREIWVQPFPSFTLICYNCAGFFYILRFIY